jgi:hypothetical protein
MEEEFERKRKDFVEQQRVLFENYARQRERDEEEASKRRQEEEEKRKAREQEAKELLESEIARAAERERQLLLDLEAARRPPSPAPPGLQEAQPYVWPWMMMGQQQANPYMNQWWPTVPPQVSQSAPVTPPSMQGHQQGFIEPPPGYTRNPDGGFQRYPDEEEFYDARSGGGGGGGSEHLSEEEEEEEEEQELESTVYTVENFPKIPPNDSYFFGLLRRLDTKLSNVKSMKNDVFEWLRDTRGVMASVGNYAETIFDASTQIALAHHRQWIKRSDPMMDLEVSHLIPICTLQRNMVSDFSSKIPHRAKRLAYSPQGMSPEKRAAYCPSLASLLFYSFRQLQVGDIEDLETVELNVLSPKPIVSVADFPTEYDSWMIVFNRAEDLGLKVVGDDRKLSKALRTLTQLILPAMHEGDRLEMLLFARQFNLDHNPTRSELFQYYSKLNARCRLFTHNHPKEAVKKQAVPKLLAVPGKTDQEGKKGGKGGGGKGGGGKGGAAPKATASDPKSPPKSAKPCQCCGGSRHVFVDCYYKEKTCKVCEKVGHLAHMCNKNAKPKAAATPKADSKAAPKAAATAAVAKAASKAAAVSKAAGTPSTS